MTEYLDSSIDFNDVRLVEAYDELPLWSASFGLMMLEHVPMREKMTVLDVGCGTGFPLLELAGRLGPSSRLYGIDPWRPALERARRKAVAYGLKNVEIIEGDAASMSFDGDFFDLIVSNLGINNFADPDTVLHECFRVLRPGGTIAITSNYSGHMQEFYDVFASTLRELELDELIPALRDHVAHRSDPQAIAARMEDAGFRVTDVETKNFRTRFASGSALFRHYFIRLGFLPAWRDIVPERDRVRVFQKLESALAGEVALTIPCVYIAALKNGAMVYPSSGSYGH